MEEERELEFEVPRPVRAPRHFAGLTLKGLGLFVSAFLFCGSIGWFVVGWIVDSMILELIAKIAAEVFIFGTAYYSFRVDEESGEMGIEPVLDYLMWRKTERTVTPIWGDEDEARF